MFRIERFKVVARPPNRVLTVSVSDESAHPSLSAILCLSSTALCVQRSNSKARSTAFDSSSSHRIQGKQKWLPALRAAHLRVDLPTGAFDLDSREGVSPMLGVGGFEVQGRSPAVTAQPHAPIL